MKTLRLSLHSERIKIIYLNDEARHIRLLPPSVRRPAGSPAAASDWLGRAGGGAPFPPGAQPTATKRGDVPDCPRGVETGEWS